MIKGRATRNPTRSGRITDPTADHGSAGSTVLNPVLGRTLVALSLALMVTFVGCQSDRTQPPEASPTRAMKGYELYSWHMQGDWYFALVVGTNRIKTYDEISSPKVRLQGLKALEREFDRLPRGEQVFWSAQRVPNTILPPDEMVDKVKAYCRQRGLHLEIAQGEVTQPEIIMSDVTWKKTVTHALRHSGRSGLTWKERPLPYDEMIIAYCCKTTLHSVRSGQGRYVFWRTRKGGPCVVEITTEES